MPEGAPVEAARPLFPPSPWEAPPSWLGRLRERPTVYATLGTVHNDLGVFRLILDSLADLDCNVTMTVGRDNDPLGLEPIPSNAFVDRYVAQSFVLPHATVVVSHGGSGSMLGAFAHGLPTLVLPRGAVQFEKAARCAALGAGLVLMPGEMTESAVRDAVRTLLEDPSYRHRARELAAEIAVMPHPRHVASRLIAAVAA